MPLPLPRIATSLVSTMLIHSDGSWRQLGFISKLESEATLELVVNNNFKQISEA
jgi:hypothetical protein